MLSNIKNIVKKQSLFQRFTIASFLIMILGMLGIGWWLGEQIRTGIIQESSATTARYMDSIISPNLQELKDSTTLTSKHIESLSDLLNHTDLGRSIVAFKVWGKDGLIIYSTTPSLIGRRFPDEDELTTAWQGQVVASMSDLSADENVEEQKYYRRLLQTYSPVRLIGTNQVIAVAEFYQTVDQMNREITMAQMRSWLVVATTMLLIYLALVGFVRQASHTINRQEIEMTDQVRRLTDLVKQNIELTERVRRAAANTTAHNEHFLRRISAELHDGPAQELGLALLHIDLLISHQESAANVSPCDEDCEKLVAIQTSLRHAIQEVRTIASGLGLPQLDELTLPECIMRAVRSHEQRTRTKVALTIETLPELATLPVKITAFRLIQEALNNAHRHAEGISQTVKVGMEGSQIRIEISDKGPGFDMSQSIDWEAHLGLAGMRERVESLGGLFNIESSSNKGTKVIAVLAIQSKGEESNGYYPAGNHR